MMCDTWHISQTFFPVNFPWAFWEHRSRICNASCHGNHAGGPWPIILGWANWGERFRDGASAGRRASSNINGFEECLQLVCNSFQHVKHVHFVIHLSSSMCFEFPYNIRLVTIYPKNFVFFITLIDMCIKITLLHLPYSIAADSAVRGRVFRS